MIKLLVEPSGPLSGHIALHGAKNAVLPIMAACLLSEEASVIERVPKVADVTVMVEILRSLGVKVTVGKERLKIEPGKFSGTVAAYDLVSQMRASICVLGPLLARQGQARVSMPGGCVIGPRPIDLHLKGLEALGAVLSIEHGYIVASGRRLKGSDIQLVGTFGSSVLATGNVMMAATLAPGVTVIEHAACEPEVVDLANFLISMGARIEGQGTPVIRVEGVEKLHGSHYTIIPDRIECGTLMMATAITGGQVEIAGARIDHLNVVVDKLKEAGVIFDVRDDGVMVSAPNRLKGVDVTTQPYPGFPTDLQAPMLALMSTADGASVLTEKIYPERFMHVSELVRMGARIKREGSSALVRGVEQLSGAPVSGSDLRATAALVIAGLVAQNQTEVSGIEHLDRGYQGFEKYISSLGACIQRVPESSRTKKRELVSR